MSTKYLVISLGLLLAIGAVFAAYSFLQNPSRAPQGQQTSPTPTSIITPVPTPTPVPSPSITPAPTPQTFSIKIYFNNSKLDPGFSCIKTFPITRNISRTTATARAAIEELLKGPMQAEISQGYFTSINSGARLQSIAIQSGVAYADFSEELERGVGGSCRVAAIRAQISDTLKQFPSVKQVQISINGRTEDILQP
ncbi:MAG: GerMN domain-containing protein [Candidatus Wildermuthbacteria bacterium]|nr:GerMN domain-containing protein [Candidatus Wildermuthbacteria bacterium]